MTSHKILNSFIFFFAFLVFASSQQYQIMDVDCLDKNDKILKNAFAGGLNSPQFNEIDLDFDGVLDLVIFDREGSAVIPYLYKDDDFQYAPQFRNVFPAFKNWIRLRDYNMDGIMDIFCYNLEAPLNGIEIYRGMNDNGTLKFEKYKETFGGFEIIYYEFQNNFYNLEVTGNDLPEIIDIDGDGDLDIASFTGDEPFVRYYTNMCIEEGISLDNPKFKLKDACWGKFKESSFSESIFLSNDPNKCADGFKGDDEITKDYRHAGSTLTLYDDDADGDMEAIIGDLTNQHLIWLHNGGTAEKAFMDFKDTIFPFYDKSVELYIFNAGFILDINRDGNNDFIAAPNNAGGSANINNVHYFENLATNGQHDFQFKEKNLFSKDMFDFGSLTNPFICDYNNDGKKDILVGTFGEFRPGQNPDAALVMLENTTSGGKLSFKIADDNYLNFKNINNTYFSFSPTMGDIDGDGDEDLFVGTQNGDLIFCENIAGPNMPFDFGPPQFKYANIDIGDNAKPQLIDLNKDGLLDLIIGERNQNPNPFNDEKIGNINYFQNQGTATEAVFESNVNTLPNTPTLGFVVTREITESFNGSAAPFFVESGDDFILYTGSETGKIKVFSGIVDSLYGTFELREDNIPDIKEGKRTTLAIGDLNDDQMLDFVIGNLRGGLSIYGSDLNLDGTVQNIEEAWRSFSMFPNPASDKVILNCSESSLFQIDLYNQAGMLSKSFRIPNWRQSDTYQFEMETSDLSSGIYFIKVLYSDGKMGVEKLLIQR